MVALARKDNFLFEIDPTMRSAFRVRRGADEFTSEGRLGTITVERQGAQAGEARYHGRALEGGAPRVDNPFGVFR